MDVATDHRWWGRIRPLDATGYLASIEECRQRFPRAADPSPAWRQGESHLFGASAGAVVHGHAFDRFLGSLHAVLVPGGGLVAADALFGVMPDGDAMRYYLAELVALIEGSDLFQVLAHPDFPRRYWPKGAHLYREELIRGGVPGGTPRAGGLRPRCLRSTPQVTAGLRRPDAVVA